MNVARRLRRAPEQAAAQDHIGEPAEPTRLLHLEGAAPEDAALAALAAPGGLEPHAPAPGVDHASDRERRIAPEANYLSVTPTARVAHDDLAGDPGQPNRLTQHRGWRR